MKHGRGASFLVHRPFLLQILFMHGLSTAQCACTRLLVPPSPKVFFLRRTFTEINIGRSQTLLERCTAFSLRDPATITSTATGVDHAGSLCVAVCKSLSVGRPSLPTKDFADAACSPIRWANRLIKANVEWGRVMQKNIENLTVAQNTTTKRVHR